MKAERPWGGGGGGAPPPPRTEVGFRNPFFTRQATSDNVRYVSLIDKNRLDIRMAWKCHAGQPKKKETFGRRFRRGRETRAEQALMPLPCRLKTPCGCRSAA